MDLYTSASYESRGWYEGLGAGGTGSCKPPDRDAGDISTVACKSVMHSLPLSHHPAPQWINSVKKRTHFFN